MHLVMVCLILSNLFIAAEGGYLFQPDVNDNVSLKSVTFDTPSNVTTIDANGHLHIPAGTSFIDANAYFENTKLVSLYISASVISIGSKAFAQCLNLTSVEFESGSKLNSISMNAFQGCTALANVQPSIPASLQTIGDYAFCQSTSMKYLSFGEGSVLSSIGNNAFEESALRSITIPPTVTSIGSFAFYKAMSLKNVTFAAGSALTSIGNYAFASSALTSIVIPAIVSTIPFYCFSSCTGLSSVEFAEGGSAMKNINEAAFYDTDLVEFDVPLTVADIQSKAFGNCKSLENVHFLCDSTANIASDAFVGSTSLTSIDLPQTCTFTGTSVTVNQRDCTVVIPTLAPTPTPPMEPTLAPTEATPDADGNVIISAGTQTIDASAYYNNSRIKTVTIPPSVIRIEDKAFYGCTQLTTIIFEGDSQLNYIGSYAFYQSGLESITIPDSVENIGDFAFYLSAFADNSNLEIVLFMSSVGSNTSESTYKIQTIGSRAFMRTNITNIVIPNSVQSLGDSAFAYCKSLTSVLFYSGSQLTSIHGQTFYYSGLTEIVFPASVEMIYAEALYMNTQLTSVGFEEGSILSIIGQASFYGTRITTISIPSYTTSIGDSAFENCYCLNAVYFMSGMSNDTRGGYSIQTLGKSAFARTNLTSVKIPDSVVTIAESCFQNCTMLTDVTFTPLSSLITIGSFAWQHCSSLKSISIPTRVKSISPYAFHFCTSLLQVTFWGNNVATIGDYAFSKCPLTNGTSQGSAPDDASAFLYIPASVNSIGSYSFGFVQPSRLTFDASSKLNQIGAYAFYSSGIAGSIDIPLSVEAIGAGAFAECTALKSVNFECNNEAVLGKDCFFDTGVKTIALPKRASCNDCGSEVLAKQSCEPSASPTTSSPTPVKATNKLIHNHFASDGNPLIATAYVLVALILCALMYYLIVRNRRRKLILKCIVDGGRTGNNKDPVWVEFTDVSRDKVVHTYIFQQDDLEYFQKDLKNKTAAEENPKLVVIRVIGHKVVGSKEVVDEDEEGGLDVDRPVGPGPVGRDGHSHRDSDNYGFIVSTSSTDEVNNPMVPPESPSSAKKAILLHARKPDASNPLKSRSKPSNLTAKPPSRRSTAKTGSTPQAPPESASLGPKVRKERKKEGKKSASALAAPASASGDDDDDAGVEMSESVTSQVRDQELEETTKANERGPPSASPAPPQAPPAPPAPARAPPAPRQPTMPSRS
eukprot:GSChrysophyteH1.ASY1.ANO1.2233.1 assembled CDS